MIRILLALALVASSLLLPGCSAQHAVRETAPLPYRHSSFDYVVSWRTAQTAEGVAVDGELKNVRYAAIESLEVTVALLRPDREVRARKTVFPIPQSSRQDETVPFSLLLKNASLEKGDLLDFVIHYRATEGGREMATEWRTMFTVDAATGVEVRR